MSLQQATHQTVEIVSTFIIHHIRWYLVKDSLAEVATLGKPLVSQVMQILIWTAWWPPQIIYGLFPISRCLRSIKKSHENSEYFTHTHNIFQPCQPWLSASCSLYVLFPSDNSQIRFTLIWTSVVLGTKSPFRSCRPCYHGKVPTALMHFLHDGSQKPRPGNHCWFCINKKSSCRP